jgi:hypothetical protein
MQKELSGGVGAPGGQKNGPGAVQKVCRTADKPVTMKITYRNRMQRLAPSALTAIRRLESRRLAAARRRQPLPLVEDTLLLPELPARV